MFVRNCWYVAAWSHEIEPESLFTRTILNEPILFIRTADGRVAAMDNRCCHRGTPLSKGRREGDAVRCMYHGIKFDPSGRCIEIPGQERIPPKMSVRSYPVIERNRWVWVWMGDTDKADDSLVPDNFACDDPGFRYKPGYLWYDVNYLYIADNLLDFSHLSYVHESTLGGTTQIAQTKPTIERLERGLRVWRRMPNSPPAPYQRKFLAQQGNVDRWFDYQFLVPGILLMNSGCKPMGRDWDDMEGALALQSCQALTPESDSSTHYFFMQAHGFALDDESVTESIRQSLVAAFEEDRQIIRAQQQMLAIGEFHFAPIGADAALNQFRQLIKRMSEAEAAARVPADA